MVHQAEEDEVVNLDVCLVPEGLGSLSGRTGVVIDVLRATTTVIAALSHGCPEVLPVDVPEEAIGLAKKLGRENHLLGGERKGYKLEGFDLGNSPREYTVEAVAGRKIILCTTNGTHTIRRAANAQAKPVLLAALVNAPAVAAHLLAAGNPATLVCSGREGAFALEDALCAGCIAAELLKQKDWTGTDGARAALALWEKFGRAKLAQSLAETDHGRYLSEIGYGADVALAAEVGAYQLLPYYRDGCLQALA